MKAYVISYKFEEVTPVVWRKVILPADVTFNRLHELIQYTTNFLSYMEPYHYFEFPLDEENLIITNNSYLIEQYVADKKRFNGVVLKQPASIKIDRYIEKYGQLSYFYDYGDGWHIHIKLEEIVDDYYFGYPTLLGGAGDAPPEDVGGPTGFSLFLEKYHAEHPETLTWAQIQRYEPFDTQRINNLLKAVAYKKTQWDKINHKNYIILSDKYRKPD